MTVVVMVLIGNEEVEEQEVEQEGVRMGSKRFFLMSQATVTAVHFRVLV